MPTPGASCTHFCDRARRLRLEIYNTWSYLEAPTDILNHFWIQVAVSEAEAKRLFCDRFGSEAVANSQRPCATAIPDTGFRSGARLWDGHGRWSKATALLFWCQSVHRELS
jgi:hypothetical protein